MSQIIARVEHEVVLFEDQDTKGIQSASIDTENWITVNHCGNEMTMHIDNWKKLVTLVHSILPNEKGGY